MKIGEFRLKLVYRDQLFPRRAYARAFEALLAKESMASTRQRAINREPRSLMVCPIRVALLRLETLRHQCWNVAPTLFFD